MESTKLLETLRRERSQLDEAIQSLKRLASGRRRRPGRAPAWMAPVEAAARESKVNNRVAHTHAKTKGGGAS
jgi:hypothetical protein